MAVTGVAMTTKSGRQLFHGHCHLKQREIKPEQLRPLAKR
jgi:hypothetical protein